MAAFKLPRLPVNWREQPQLFERYWDEAMTKIEETFNAILEIPALQDAIEAAQTAADNANAAADSAQTAADTAQSAADSAQAVADSATLEQSIVNSYPTGWTTNLIEADNAGNVIIDTHNRVYGDPALNPTVLIDGNMLSTGENPGTVIRVFYDDPTRAGGSVAYQWTVDPAAPPVQGGSRHVVGAVTIPAAGVQVGNPVTPPGYVSP